MTDLQLLNRFVTGRDENAFEDLVTRHGRMVLGICRHVLDDPHEAEDAFQATFLILMRKADTLREGNAVGPWLAEVAYHTALRARQQAARRRTFARTGLDVDPPGPSPDLLKLDLRPVVDEEVDRLPEKYRAPVILCYMEGQTHEQAAKQLRWPIGTVKGRLARARDVLRDRLARRGVALGLFVWLSLRTTGARAAMPDQDLTSKTVEAAKWMASLAAVLEKMLGAAITPKEVEASKRALAPKKADGRSFASVWVAALAASILAFALGFIGLEARAELAAAFDSQLTWTQLLTGASGHCGGGASSEPAAPPAPRERSEVRTKTDAPKG